MNYVISYNGGTGNDVVLTAAAPVTTPPSAIPALDRRALAALAAVLALIAAALLRR